MQTAATLAAAERPTSVLTRMLGSRFVAALTHPHSIDRYLVLVSPTWSIHEVRAEVTHVRRETRDVTTLTLKPNALWRGHRAGQYVALTVEIAGVNRTRCFSISSAPTRASGTFEVTVKARPSGAVTPTLVHHTTPGTVVGLSQAQGDFVLPEVLPERLLFVSGGSGITPLMSMLRALTASGGRLPEVTFVHFARSRDDVIFRDALATLARTHRSLRLVIETEAESGRPPALDEHSLAAIVPDYDRIETWACGPESLLAATTKAFQARDAIARLHTERFGFAQSPVNTAPTEARVRFSRSKVEANARDGGSLLAMAEGAGVALASGCRMGICRTCVCRKVSGTTRDLRTGALSEDADVEVQACVSAPVGDVTIDL